MMTLILRSISFSATVLRQSSFRNPKERFKPRNPGISRRLQAIKEDGTETAIGPDMDYDESEPNTYNLRNVQKHFEKKVTKNHEMLSNRIVEQKYFSEPLPNFLTWSEKEQIRYLYKHNPNEWTPEKISQSFPLTEEGAKKTLKAVWLPASEQRIRRHDISALRNWRELKEGTNTNISKELRERLLKFSDRVIPPRTDQAIEETKQLSIKKPKSNEFGSIVMDHNSSKVFKDKTKLIESEEFESNCDSRSGHDIIVKDADYYRSKRVTLDSLRSEISEKLESNELSISEKLLISPKENTEISRQNEDVQVEPATRVNSQLNLTNHIRETLKLNEFQERIRIPKKAYKRGSTYKVNDCYYDDDGHFLYRVPGMSG